MRTQVINTDEDTDADADAYTDTKADTGTSTETHGFRVAHTHTHMDPSAKLGRCTRSLLPFTGNYHRWGADAQPLLRNFRTNIITCEPTKKHVGIGGALNATLLRIN